MPDAFIPDFIAGFIVGFLNSSIAVPGVPLGIYILLKQWDADRARGNMGILFFLIDLYSAVFLVADGVFQLSLIPLIITSTLLFSLGTVLGIRIGRHVSTDLFRKIVLIFLLCSASLLAYRSVVWLSSFDL